MSEDHPFVEKLPDDEPRDYTKFLWIGVAVLVIIMLIAIAMSGRRDPTRSQVRARHILVQYVTGDAADRARALDLITGIRQDLVDGADFGSLARDYSDDPGSAARGGDLGYHKRGIFDPPFEAFVWSAPIGELSDVIEGTFGFHVIEVLDRHVSEVDRYEQEVEEKALERLREQNSGAGS